MGKEAPSTLEACVRDQLSQREEERRRAAILVEGIKTAVRRKKLDDELRSKPLVRAWEVRNRKELEFLEKNGAMALFEEAESILRSIFSDIEMMVNIHKPPKTIHSVDSRIPVSIDLRWNFQPALRGWIYAIITCGTRLTDNQLTLYLNCRKGTSVIEDPQELEEKLIEAIQNPSVLFSVGAPRRLLTRMLALGGA